MSNPFVNNEAVQPSFYESDRQNLSALIASVDKGTPASEAGLEPGDIILRVNGEKPRDLIDWMWLTDSDYIKLEVLARPEEGFENEPEIHIVEIERDLSEPWGINFADVVFDKVIRCHNNCAFCFMNQLPKGMRTSLYLKDDDYRLSFLQGNFVTLTNLGQEDINRIIEQRISPLNVSFHAYNAEVRKKLMGKNAERGIEAFEALAKAGIEMNIQIVLVPQINDGEVLDETLKYLKKFKAQVPSVGIVPVAFTNQTKEIAGLPPKSYADKLEAAKIISQVQLVQFESRAEDETTWVHLADEFYILAEAPFPKPEWYDGYPQYENGIGIVWNYVEEVKEHFEDYQPAILELPVNSNAVTIICGQLSTHTIVGALEALGAGGRVRLLPVPNYYFGGNVSVTGLLTGEDLVRAIKHDAAGIDHKSVYLIPKIIFNADRVTLDDYTEDDIKTQSGQHIVFQEMGGEGMVAAMRDALKIVKEEF